MPPLSASVHSSRPSDGRRQALAEDMAVPVVSNFFPIERYYETADKVYQTFQARWLEITSTAAADDSNEAVASLNELYVWGKRYCYFCLEAIPKHNYYGRTAFGKLQKQHTLQVKRVLDCIEEIANIMDMQEVKRQERQEAERKKRMQEQERKAQAAIEAFSKQFSQQKSSATTTTSGTDLEASALSKLALLRPTPPPPASENRPVRRDPSGEPPTGQPGSRYRLLDESDEEDQDPNLPPPVLPPPPSYFDVIPPTSSPKPSAPPAPPPSLRIGPVHDNDTPSPKAATKPRKQKQHMSMAQLQQHYKKEYLRYESAGKIQVGGLATYQGRLSASTNGCTVISALMAATHLQRPQGLTNTDAVQVIDQRCGPLLKQIRSKLKLGSHALIIPSDVHDHLVDAKILRQEDFVGAAGGNIMDPNHLGDFLRMLSVSEDGKGQLHRAAATLFFREHVISIVKFPVGPNQVYYDLVDSLPSSYNRNGQSMASRTRCHDLESLQVLLWHYASRKFSPQDCQFIDKQTWSDMMADVDPRVFQGFVWALKQ